MSGPRQHMITFGDPDDAHDDTPAPPAYGPMSPGAFARRGAPETGRVLIAIRGGGAIAGAVAGACHAGLRGSRRYLVVEVRVERALPDAGALAPVSPEDAARIAAAWNRIDPPALTGLALRDCAAIWVMA